MTSPQAYIHVAKRR